MGPQMGSGGRTDAHRSLRPGCATSLVTESSGVPSSQGALQCLPSPVMKSQTGGAVWESVLGATAVVRTSLLGGPLTISFHHRDLKVSNLLMTDKGCVKTGGRCTGRGQGEGALRECHPEGGRSVLTDILKAKNGLLCLRGPRQQLVSLHWVTYFPPSLCPSQRISAWLGPMASR